ncbi:retrovirus-related Pol polyprotein from transposon 17.6 [Trichonephila clavipes]|nr:retrovirus-related Pol polyprotein from transposon 17.6 [Trichonephila clavipes]
MITNFFIPELNNHDVQELWFQQDGATCHTARATIDLFKDSLGDRLISRFGPVNWPPRSCDLTPLDYFLWGYVKSLVYADKPQTLDHLEDNIRLVIADIRPQMLEKVTENWTSRLDYIRASRGSPTPEIIFKMSTRKFVLDTELNVKFDKSITIATLKDPIISSENYDEELTKNIHSTIVEDRKAREENLRIEEQKEKLRIEEREEKLRFEQLSTSPGVFQRYVSSTFRDLTRKGIVISYLDDLVIPAKIEQEGLEKLKIIFEVAKKYGLEIKFKKCQFLKKKIEFLGLIVESGTIKPSPTKTLAVRKFPEPTTIKQVQSFLGLTGYFRKYIKDYSKIAKPLSDLTRKENLFVFGTQQKEAFEKLKKIMFEGPILHLYKYGRKTELHTDACKQGYGAILLQEAEDGKLHPVYHMSKKTNTAEEKYDSYELEVLAIINALKKFRVYLLGQHFRIVTDWSAFQKTMQKKDLITRIARWALQLEEFDYEIEHRAGSRMKHVDALCRYPVMMVSNDTLTSKLKKAQEEDDNIETFKSLLEKQESEEFLSEMVYSTTNKKTRKKEGFLNPISKESIPLSTYHVDFISPLPSTNKSYQHIFTVVHAFTKFTWLYPVKTVSAESALEKLKQQQKTFGNPIRIISDRGSAFTSKLFNDYCDEENIQHLQIATGVPRGNGQVERIHRTLIPVLTKLSLDDSTKWYKYVDRLQRIINSTICRSTKWTPFELLVGIKMRNKEDILIKDLLLEEIAKELLEQREFLRNDAKKNIETLQSENRKTYNRRRKKASIYKEGDLVAIQRTQFGAGLKLRPNFLGPYKVTKVNSKDRYEVEKVGQHEGPNSTTTSADLMKHFYA